MNTELWIAVGLVIAVVCALAYATFKKSKAATPAMIGPSPNTVAVIKADMVSHAEASMQKTLAAAKTDFAKFTAALKHHAAAVSVAAAQPAAVPASVADPAAPAQGAIAAAVAQPTEKSAMALLRPAGSASMFAHQAPAPQGIEILNDFKSYAKACQVFLDLKSEAERWVYFTKTSQLLPFQALFGITPGWINAFYSGAALVDGLGVYAYTWDWTNGRMVTHGNQPVTEVVLTWVGGAPPAYYQPSAPKAATGADAVTAFLTEAAAESASLRNHGLTDEAIAAARA